MDLFEAIAAGDTDTVTGLLARDPTLSATRHSTGATPVLYALYQQQRDLAGTLARLLEPLDLTEAAALDDTDRVTELLDGGEPVDRRTPDGFTPLHLAAFFGGEHAARLLLDRGADVAAVADNPMRIQALHAAVAGRWPAITRLLLAAGADPNARQRNGFTPLMSAAGAAHAELVADLLAAGADPTLANDEGSRAADVAREHGYAELADRLST